MLDALPVRVAADVRVVVPLPAPVASGWAAYTEPALRRRWFRLPGSPTREEVDVREGGHHLLAGTFRLEDRVEQLDARCRFLELVAPERIVWTYEVRVDGLLRSASLCLTELRPAAAGTELVHEEQVLVLAATEEAAAAGVAERRGGLRLQLNGWRAVALDVDGSSGAGGP